MHLTLPLLISLYPTWVCGKTSEYYLSCSNAVLRLMTAWEMTYLNKVNKSKETNKTIAAWQGRHAFFHKGGKRQARLSYHRSLYVFFSGETKLWTVKFTE